MAEQQTTQRPLKGIAEIRHFFRTNTTPIFFVGATPFNLLGLDRWVRNFDYISYYDAWDGQHPRVFTPKDKPYIEFESGEEINNYLLQHPEVKALHAAGRRAAQGGDGLLRRGDRKDLHRTGLRPDPAVRGAARTPGFEDRHDQAG